MDNWDFDCPQFVDFATALDSPSNEVFNDVTDDVPGTTTVERYDLGPKMATPKVKPNDPLKNFPCANFTTDDEKLATLSKLPARFSKSDGCLNQIVQPRKRRSSFSVNYIRKRRICPTTPNCLKRSVQNSKLQKAKTSEQLELQRIAEMQNMLHKHLRLNEINFKRMKMNKAPITLEKLPKRSESEVPSIRSNVAVPSKPTCISNRNFNNENNNFACGAQASSTGINNFLESLKTKEKLNVSAKKKAPPNVLRDRNALEKDNNKTLKKIPLFERKAHGGLKFLPHLKETKPCPFSFDTSTTSSCNASHLETNLSKIHTSFSVSRNTVMDNKENLLK